MNIRGSMGGPPPIPGARPPMPPGRKGIRRGNWELPPQNMRQPPADNVEFYEENFDLKEMERECEDMLKVRYLTRDNCKFSLSAGGFVTLDFDKNIYENVDIIRTFPFTMPDELLSVRESTGKKREIGIIKNLTTDFDKDTVNVISKHLELRYYMPVIEKIISIKEVSGYVHFKVNTNHGEINFSLQSNGNHFSYLSDTRILITDLEGNRYEIPDVKQLTAKELKKLDLYM